MLHEDSVVDLHGKSPTSSRYATDMSHKLDLQELLWRVGGVAVCFRLSTRRGEKLGNSRETSALLAS